ncbi:MAG: PAS domain S-box protein [Proteobacteria bacterium]|nr:PAS domain S-box protein [Pseudomonadota bacterium]
MIGLVGLIAGAVLLLSAWHIHERRTQAIENAERNASNLARTLEEHAARAFGETDLVLRSIADDVRTHPFDEARLHALLREKYAALPQVRTMLIFNIDGELVADSVAFPHRRGNSGDREFFLVHKQSSAAGLHIGEPFQNRLNRAWTIAVTRRLESADGTFAGIVSASIEIAYFNGFYRSIDIGPHGTIQLFRDDGIMLMREPFIEKAIGLNVGQNNMFRNLIPAATTGTFQVKTLVDGVERLLAYRKLTRFPLVVLVGLAHEDTLARWREETRQITTLAFGTVLLIALLAFLLIRQFRNLQVMARQLELSERRFRDFAGAASDWLWEMGPDLRFTFISDRIKTLLGTDPREIVGKTREDLVGQVEDREAYERHLEDLRNHRPFRNFTYTRRRSGGTIRQLRVSGMPIFDEHGAFLGYRGIGSDVTNEVEAARAAHKAEEDYRALFENAPIGIYRSSVDGRQLRANPALVRLNGYASEAELLSSVRDIATEWYVDPNRRAEFKRLLERDGQVVEFESEIYRHKGRERIWISEDAKLVRDANGAPSYYEGTVRDITAQRQALRLAEERRRIIETVIEAVPARIVVKDRDLRYTLVNRRQAAWQGRRPEEVVGKTLAEIRGEAFAVPFHESEAKMFETGRTQLPFEETLVDAHGNSATTMTSKVPILDENGRVAYIVVIAIDITERKQIEIDLLKAKTEAEHANRAKSEFLANMSHELRTPLNAIIGFSEIIRDQLLGQEAADKYADYAGDIHRSGQHLLDVINDILDMSKIEAGHYELADENIDPAAVVEACLTMVHGRASAGQVDIRNLIDADAPIVCGDRRAFKQVILNLLSNAVKFTRPGGKVTISTEIERGGSFALSIADTGIGISAKDIERIFEPFQQADPNITREFDGTGLGLSISRRLMELHGGQLSLNSEVAVGTVATVRFPASRVTTKDAEQDQGFLDQAQIAD